MCVLCQQFGSSFHDGTSLDGSSGTFSADPIDAAPSFSLSQIVNQLRTQWGSGTGQYAEGTYRAWFGGNVSYGINYVSTNGTVNGEVLTGMTAAMQNVAREGFELWDDLIAINLNEVAS